MNTLILCFFFHVRAIRILLHILVLTIPLALSNQVLSQRLLPALVTEGELHERVQWPSDLWVDDGFVAELMGLKELNGELVMFRYITPSNESISLTYDGQSLSSNNAPSFDSGVSRIYRLRSVGDSTFVCGALGGSDPQEVLYHNGLGWESLPPLSLSRIYDVANYQGQLYVSGRGIDGGPGLFRWNGNGWETPEVSINNDVYCIIEHEGELIAGGAFTSIAGQSINYIASYNGTGWSELGTGLGDAPTCLIHYMDQLHVVGDFDADGNGNELPGIAVYDNGALSPPDWQGVPENGIRARDAFVHNNMLVINGGGNGNLTFPPLRSWRIEGNQLTMNELTWTGASSFSGDAYVATGQSDLAQSHFFANSRLFKLVDEGATSASLVNDHLSVQLRTLGNLFQTATVPGVASAEIDPLGSLVFAAALWYSAAEGENLYAVNPQYDNDDEEPNGLQNYFGPYSECYDEVYLKRYFRTWSITRQMIDDHTANYDSPNYSTPEPLLNYPATGRPWCDESSLLAPFNDINENGTYEPSQGETPIIHGDQSVFLLMHDRLGGSQESPGFESLIEVYTVDSQDEILSNTIYLSISIRNRSGRNYEDVKLGFWSDLDIGASFDDRVGCSPENNYYYGYNAFETDAGGPSSGAFNENVPAVGVVFLNRTLESFINFNGQVGPLSAPFLPDQIRNTLSGNWRFGESILLGGNGHVSGAWDPPVETNHLYPDFPWEDSKGSWSEVTENIPSGDRKALGATSIGGLVDRSSVCFDLAIVVAYPENDDLFSEVAVLDAAIPGVVDAYSNLNEICTWEETPIGIEEQTTEAIAVFPNPADASLNIRLESANAARFDLYDIQGRLTKSGQLVGSHSTIDVSGVHPGMYLLVVHTASLRETLRVMVK